MNLIPEDGSGLENANSYASVAEADAFHDARLHTLAWTNADQETKERALATATMTLDAMVIWSGNRLTAEQALAWPRENAEYDGLVVGDHEVPRPVKNATAELAKLMLAGDLTADVAQNNLQGLKLGKGALEIDFKSTGTKQRIPTAIEELLMGVGRFKPTSGGLRMANVFRG